MAEDTVKTIQIPWYDADTLPSNIQLFVRRLPWSGRLFAVAENGTDILIPFASFNIPPGIFTLRYYPPLNTVTRVSFEVILFDGQSWSNSIDIWIEITPVNDPPVSFNISASIIKESLSLATLTCNDIDSGSIDIKYRFLSVPSNNSISLYPSDESGSPRLTEDPISAQVNFMDNRVWIVPFPGFLGTISIPYQCAGKYKLKIYWLI